MHKTLIRYSHMLTDAPTVGRCVYVVVSEHPNTELVGRSVRTSPVTDMVPIVGDTRPVFSTLNSIYVPDNWRQ